MKMMLANSWNRSFSDRKTKRTSEAYDLASTNATNMRQMHDKLVADIGELEARKDMIKEQACSCKNSRTDK